MARSVIDAVDGLQAFCRPARREPATRSCHGMVLQRFYARKPDCRRTALWSAEEGRRCPTRSSNDLPKASRRRVAGRAGMARLRARHPGWTGRGLRRSTGRPGVQPELARLASRRRSPPGGANRWGLNGRRGGRPLPFRFFPPCRRTRKTRFFAPRRRSRRPQALRPQPRPALGHGACSVATGRTPPCSATSAA